MFQGHTCSNQKCQIGEPKHGGVLVVVARVRVGPVVPYQSNQQNASYLNLGLYKVLTTLPMIPHVGSEDSRRHCGFRLAVVVTGGVAAAERFFVGAATGACCFLLLANRDPSGHNRVPCNKGDNYTKPFFLQEPLFVVASNESVSGTERSFSRPFEIQCWASFGTAWSLVIVSTVFSSTSRESEACGSSQENLMYICRPTFITVSSTSSNTPKVLLL